jgi:hypothetical protein
MLNSNINLKIKSFNLDLLNKLHKIKIELR